MHRGAPPTYARNPCSDLPIPGTVLGAKNKLEQPLRLKCELTYDAGELRSDQHFIPEVVATLVGLGRRTSLESCP